jgi:hypothetical protein
VCLSIAAELFIFLVAVKFIVFLSGSIISHFPPLGALRSSPSQGRCWPAQCVASYHLKCL